MKEVCHYKGTVLFHSPNLVVFCTETCAWKMCEDCIKRNHHTFWITPRCMICRVSVKDKRLYAVAEQGFSTRRRVVCKKHIEGREVAFKIPSTYGLA